MADESEKGPENADSMGMDDGDDQDVISKDEGMDAAPDGESIDEGQARRIAGEEFEDRISTAETLLALKPRAKMPAWLTAIAGALVAAAIFAVGWFTTFGEVKATAFDARDKNRLQDAELVRLNAEKADSKQFQTWLNENTQDHRAIKADQKEQTQELKDVSKKLDRILLRIDR